MQTPQPPLGRAQDEAAIRGLEAAYDAAWQQGDIDALVACLTEEAVVVNPRGQLARGRAEIATMLGVLLSGPAKGSKHTSQVWRVEFITEEVAIVDGEAVLDGFVVSDGPSKSSSSHRFTDVVVRGSEGWAIAHVRAYVVMAEGAA